MWNEEPPKEFTDTMYGFIESCISVIHKTQDFDTFIKWVKQNNTDFISLADNNPSFAILIARSIWNKTPLSSNRYRPLPLPAIKRNGPCFCGSGKKYKQCCIDLPDPNSTLDTDAIWSLLLNELNQGEIAEALSLHALPIPAILELADSYLDDARLLEATEILEPIFNMPSEKMGENECFALNSLCNVYDDFGLKEMEQRKITLLNRLKDQGSKLIRSEAWQRLSTISMDKGDNKAAWKAFQTAQRLTPNSQGIDLLEINLLLGEKNNDLAQKRAKIILKKSHRNGTYEKSAYFDFLQDVANNPQEVINKIMPEQETLHRLIIWLEQVAGRRLPVYKLKTFEADYLWLEEGQKTPTIQTGLFADNEKNEILDNLPKNEHCLVTPKSIKKLERQWKQVFEQQGEVGNFPWDETEWLEFLEKNPQCFASAEIIDDLLIGLEEWQQDVEIVTQLVIPLSQRAWQIYESLPEQEIMPWSFMENRSLYSALYSMVGALKHLGKHDEAMHYTMKLIRINPNDNLGLRSELINYYLEQKAYNKVFKLASRYPKDIMLDINMAKTLSFWATGDERGAQEQWQKIKEYNPHIEQYMTASRIAAPELDSYGTRMGGEDEAWYYREAMRNTWVKHKGAINWLKQN